MFNICIALYSKNDKRHQYRHQFAPVADFRVGEFRSVLFNYETCDHHGNQSNEAVMGYHKRLATVIIRSINSIDFC
jgi:hypothetical protein